MLIDEDLKCVSIVALWMGKLFKKSPLDKMNEMTVTHGDKKNPTTEIVKAPVKTFEFVV